MFATSKRVSIYALPATVLLAAALALPVHAADRSKSRAKNDGVGLGVSLGSVKAGVGAGVGSSKGLVDADVKASVGGRNGVNADVKGTVAGRKGLADADVNASVGGRSGIDARAKANVGGSKGLVDADVKASVGGGSGITAGIGANVGGDDLLDVNVDVGLGEDDIATRPDPDRPDDKPVVRNPDRDVIRDFSRLSDSDRQQMIKRCRGITGGGYDLALVKLCRLLETASR